MKKAIQHLLIIRLLAMGDVAMTVPVIQILARQYPHLQLTVLSRKFFEPLFSDIPNLHFFEADVNGRHKGPIGLQRLCTELKARGIDGC